MGARSEVRPRLGGARLKCAARAFPQGVLQWRGFAFPWYVPGSPAEPTHIRESCIPGGVRGVHRPSVSNELNCTGKRAGVREWKGRPCLCRESHEPVSPAACLHVTRPTTYYHVLRVHACTHAETILVSRGLNYRGRRKKRASCRGVAVFAPDYDLFASFFLLLSSPKYFSFDYKNTDGKKSLERRGQEGSVFTLERFVGEI